MDRNDIDARLRADLRQALRDRNQAATRAIRRFMAAIDNAGAVPQPPDAPAPVINPGDPVVPQYADVQRAAVSADEIAGILAAEIDSLSTAIAEYDGLGATERAAGLRHEKDALERYRDDPRG